MVYFQVAAKLKLARFDKESAAKAAEFEPSAFPDKLLQREFKLIKDIGTSALKNETKLARVIRDSLLISRRTT